MTWLQRWPGPGGARSRRRSVMGQPTRPPGNQTGNLATRQPTRQPGTRTGSRATPATNPATRQPGNPATNLATRQPTRHTGNQPFNQPCTPATNPPTRPQPPPGLPTPQRLGQRPSRWAHGARNDLGRSGVGAPRPPDQVSHTVAKWGSTATNLGGPHGPHTFGYQTATYAGTRAHKY